MTRRFVYDRAHDKMVEVTESPAPRLSPDSGALWGDENYRGMRATDGTPIDTRTKHREYMKRNGLTTVDDYAGKFNEAARSREDFFRGADPARRRDIERALAKRRG